MPFSFMPSSPCQDIGQCNPSLPLISTSGLICDVIFAIDLEEVRGLGNLFAPLLYHLTLAEYGTYHHIAKILSFHMIYNLLLKSKGWLILLLELTHSFYIQCLRCYSKVDITQ